MGVSDFPSHINSKPSNFLSDTFSGGEIKIKNTLRFISVFISDILEDFVTNYYGNLWSIMPPSPTTKSTHNDMTSMKMAFNLERVGTCLKQDNKCGTMHKRPDVHGANHCHLYPLGQGLRWNTVESGQGGCPQYRRHQHTPGICKERWGFCVH